MRVTTAQISNFKLLIMSYYHDHKRELEWRDKITPYRVFISEIMLQQTQVNRVQKKFPEFIENFPDFSTLAKGSITRILSTWQGMGYNRRALCLKKSAEIILERYKGTLPHDPILLDKLPGIGHATANSIVVFAYNIPKVFIETNIRKVFIHVFFKKKINSFDSDILSLVERSLDIKNPRDWYYALMDYGASLSKLSSNPNRKSNMYRKQISFINSNRQIRGQILTHILKSSLNLSEIEKKIQFPKKRIYDNLNNLIQEGFIIKKEDKYHIQ